MNGGTIILTPNVHAPVGLLQFGDDDGRNGELLDVAGGCPPPLEEILGPVARPVTRLPPVGDKFPRHLERVGVIQADLLTAEGAALTLVGGITNAAAATA